MSKNDLETWLDYCLKEAELSISKNWRPLSNDTVLSLVKLVKKYRATLKFLEEGFKSVSNTDKAHPIKEALEYDPRKEK